MAKSLLLIAVAVAVALLAVGPVVIEAKKKASKKSTDTTVTNKV